MKYVSFKLTMPNVGSWNGQWTGDKDNYYILKNMPDSSFDKYILPLFPFPIVDGIRETKIRHFYYSFGDGWGANVEMEIIDKDTYRKRLKNTAGFCGYGWMVDSILKNGKIIIEE